MTKDEVIQHLCETVALVYRSIGDYTHPSDGFCPKCHRALGPSWNFEHAGHTLEYVRQAVIDKLIADGHSPKLELLEKEQ